MPSQVIYEVSTTVENAHADAFLHWLDDFHVQEVLKIDGFIEATISERNLEFEQSGFVTTHRGFVVSYVLDSPAALDNYLHNHAAAMRQDGLSRFGGHFSATRRSLAIVSNKTKQ
jgi:hypothetical protein